MIFFVIQLSSAMSSEAKEANTQLSSLKAIAEQAVVQANLFPSAKKLQEDNDTLRSKYKTLHKCIQVSKCCCLALNVLVLSSQVL